jgi:RimJ/RimL family protein N-acetyltransferase
MNTWSDGSAETLRFVTAFNPRAQRTYEEAGFVVEGVQRDALKWDAERVDDVMMAILRPEWEALRSEV